MRYPQKAKELKEDSQGSNYKIKLVRECQMEAKNLIDSRRSSILVLFSMKTLWFLSSQSFHNVAEIALNHKIRPLSSKEDPKISWKRAS